MHHNNFDSGNCGAVSKLRRRLNPTNGPAVPLKNHNCDFVWNGQKLLQLGSCSTVVAVFYWRENERENKEGGVFCQSQPGAESIIHSTGVFDLGCGGQGNHYTCTCISEVASCFGCKQKQRLGITCRDQMGELRTRVSFCLLRWAVTCFRGCRPGPLTFAPTQGREPLCSILLTRAEAGLSIRAYR